MLTGPGAEIAYTIFDIVNGFDPPPWVKVHESRFPPSLWQASQNLEALLGLDRLRKASLGWSVVMAPGFAGGMVPSLAWETFTDIGRFYLFIEPTVWSLVPPYPTGGIHGSKDLGDLRGAVRAIGDYVFMVEP